FVGNCLECLAEEVREHLAGVGVRSVEEAIGDVERLETAKAIEHWKASGLDLAPILHVPDVDGPRHCVTAQDHGLDKALDNTLIQLCEGVLDVVDAEQVKPVRLELPIRNVNRTVGTMLGH